MNNIAFARIANRIQSVVAKRVFRKFLIRDWFLLQRKIKNSQVERCNTLWQITSVSFKGRNDE